MIDNGSRIVYQTLIAIIALVFLVLSSSLWAIPTRIVVNSGFETPDISSDPAQCYSATYAFVDSDLLAGWETTHRDASVAEPITANCGNASGKPVEVWNDGVDLDGTGSNPPITARTAGSQFVELNAYEASYLYQNICMIAGESLSYSYYHRRRETTGIETTQARLKTTGNIDIDSSGNHSVSDNNWTEHTGTLTNNSTTGVVRYGFESLGGGVTGNFIDDVNVMGLRALAEIKGFTQNSVGEGGSTVFLEIYISGMLLDVATLTLNLKGGSTATPGNDFTVATGAMNRGTVTGFDSNSGLITLSLPAGNYDPNEDSGSEAGLIQIPISILSDTLFETDDTLAYENNSMSGGGAGNSNLDLQLNDADCNTETRVETAYLTILESSSEPTLTIEKTASRKTASIGDILQYQLKLSNSTSISIQNLDVQDRLPEGFKLLENTVRKLNETTGKTEPISHQGTRIIELEGIDLVQNTSTTILYSVVISSGVKPGRKINRAQIVSSLTGDVLSNEATAAVDVVPDPIFEMSTIIGKVFHDKNNNGYQDEGESGLSGIRLATVAGEWITTDVFGRFSYPGLNTSASGRGRNFILKLDVRSLPDGYGLLTSNPAIIRVTEGMMHKVNFAAYRREYEDSQCQDSMSGTIVDTDDCKLFE